VKVLSRACGGLPNSLHQILHGMQAKYFRVIDMENRVYFLLNPLVGCSEFLKLNSSLKVKLLFFSLECFQGY
jgi:hypothetical protein